MQYLLLWVLMWAFPVEAAAPQGEYCSDGTVLMHVDDEWVCVPAGKTTPLPAPAPVVTTWQDDLPLGLPLTAELGLGADGIVYWRAR